MADIQQTDRYIVGCEIYVRYTTDRQIYIVGCEIYGGGTDRQIYSRL